MKKLFSLTLCIALLCLLAIPASASTGNERLLEYDHIDTITANITMDRFWGIASCDGAIEANGVYPVYVEVYLQQKKDGAWETLKTWTSEGDSYTEASGRYAVAKGYQYRAYTVGRVYDYDGNLIDSATASYSVTYD